MPEEPEVYSKEELRIAQGLTGELLWLSIRTRPDIAYVTSLMGRLATKNPRFTAKLGREVLEYLAATKEVGLKYGPVESGDFGPEGCLAFARNMKRVEVFADVSFAPQSSKSVHGIVAMYGGCPIQWLSNRQGCLTLSTAESELLSYIEAMSVADSVGCVISILEDIPIEFDSNIDEGEDREIDDVTDEDFAGGGGDCLQRVGDNQAAVSVLCSPDGPWSMEDETSATEEWSTTAAPQPQASLGSSASSWNTAGE